MNDKSEAPIAWIGLGLIGLPMASRLVQAGRKVRGFDIDAKRMELARARGISLAADAPAAISGAGIVFTSLPSEDALVGAAAAIAGAMRRDAILVETSTVGPDASAAVAKALQGMAYLRAPISGSTALAETGQLSTFVSGPRAAFEAALPAFRAYTRAQSWLGEGEEARYAKLAVNLMVAVTAGMMGEALAFARKGGIGWQAMLDVIADSVVASPLVKYKLDPLRKRDFTPAATNSLVLKDLHVLVESAARAGVPLPLANHMLGAYRGLVEAGGKDEDFFSAVKVAERAAGLGDP